MSASTDTPDLSRTSRTFRNKPEDNFMRVAAVSLQRGLDGARGEDTKYAFAFLIPIDLEPN